MKKERGTLQHSKKKRKRIPSIAHDIDSSIPQKKKKTFLFFFFSHLVEYIQY